MTSPVWRHSSKLQIPAWSVILESTSSLTLGGSDTLTAFSLNTPDCVLFGVHFGSWGGIDLTESGILTGYVDCVAVVVVVVNWLTCMTGQKLTWVEEVLLQRGWCQQLFVGGGLSETGARLGLMDLGVGEEKARDWSWLAAGQVG